MPPILSLFTGLAKEIAIKHELDPALVCAVIEQESAWNPWAVRYEPDFLKKYVAPLYVTGSMTATEAYTRSMSWGLMQVMGETARELGFDRPYLVELCDVATGVEIGCLKLKKCFAKTTDSAIALNVWNGGANPQYAIEVLARKKTYA